MTAALSPSNDVPLQFAATSISSAMRRNASTFHLRGQRQHRRAEQEQFTVLRGTGEIQLAQRRLRRPAARFPE